MTSLNTKMAGVLSSTPLQITKPTDIFVFLSFFSPIILAIGITGTSFIFQNFKGLIYLALLIFCCVIRNFVYIKSGAIPMINDGTICTSIQYSKYGNPTFSAFVFAFTIVYLSIPMFSNDTVNYWVFISLITYFITDIFIKIYNKCIQIGDLLLNILLGVASAWIIVTIIYKIGYENYLLFNEMSSNKDMYSDKEICYKPSKQTFKCQMFRNGQLINEL